MPRMKVNVKRIQTSSSQRTYQNERTYVGIDNGVSGSIGIVQSDVVARFFKTPTSKHLNYTKKVKHISRIEVEELRNILSGLHNPMAVLERPMINPGRFDATISACRALEALLIVLEELDIPYRYIDSKEWQSKILPKGIKGSDKLKKASLDVGSRLFPQFKDKFKSQKDADGMLIAECARRERW